MAAVEPRGISNTSRWQRGDLSAPLRQQEQQQQPGAGCLCAPGHAHTCHARFPRVPILPHRQLDALLDMPSACCFHAVSLPFAYHGNSCMANVQQRGRRALERGAARPHARPAQLTPVQRSGCWLYAVALRRHEGHLGAVIGTKSRPRAAGMHACVRAWPCTASCGYSVLRPTPQFATGRLDFTGAHQRPTVWGGRACRVLGTLASGTALREHSERSSVNSHGGWRRHLRGRSCSRPA